MVLRNFAILAHVDAGKTTLAERILFNAGLVRHPGEVDDGLATMDYLPEEKERGITIEAGLASFNWKGIHCNFLDTPGHVDFGIEVDLSLEAVEGAVLVVDATAGVETQTISAWRRLQDKGVRTLLFLNKLDRQEALPGDALLDIEERLSVRPVILSFPFRDAQSNQEYSIDVLSKAAFLQNPEGKEVPVALPPAAEDQWNRLRKEAVEAASTADDHMLYCALEGIDPEPTELAAALLHVFSQGVYAPVFQGSALCNTGVRQLMTAIGVYLPPPQDTTHSDAIGKVVRIRHHRSLGEVVLLKTFCGLARPEIPPCLELYRVEAETLQSIDSVSAGDIVALQWKADVGGTHVSLGNQVSRDGSIIRGADDLHLSLQRPLLFTMLVPQSDQDAHKLTHALDLIERSDPSLRIETDAQTGNPVVHTVGEVQLQVVLSRLDREFGCRIVPGEPKLDWRERLIVDCGPFSMECTGAGGLVRIAANLQCLFQDAVQVVWVGSPLPSEVQASMDRLVHSWAEQGVMGRGRIVGLQVCLDIVEDANGDYGILHKALYDLLRLEIPKSAFEMQEPWVEIELECPQEHVGKMLGDLESRGAEVKSMEGDGRLVKIICDGPLQEFIGYSIIGRSISKGTASYALRYSRHRAARSIA